MSKTIERRRRLTMPESFADRRLLHRRTTKRATRRGWFLYTPTILRSQQVKVCVAWGRGSNRLWISVDGPTFRRLRRSSRTYLQALRKKFPNRI